MPNKMTPEEIAAKVAENERLLDGLELPMPELVETEDESKYENVTTYCTRVANLFKDISLPEDYREDMFFWLDFNNLGNYIAHRFNIEIEEFPND